MSAEPSYPVPTPEERLEELIEQAFSLPLGNQAALTRLAVLCDNPLSTAHGIALEAARDENFSALLLKLANSAYSGSSQRISDLTTAVARLGLRLVQGLAVAAPGLRLLHGPYDGLGPARHELHRHAVRVGLAARILAPKGTGSERALTAGLIHNLGLNVLSLYATEDFRELTRAAARGEQLSACEEELGFSHAELGARLAERWSYPAELVETIRLHADPVPGDRLAALIRVADLLVREHGIGVEAAGEVTPELLAAAGVTVSNVRAWVAPLLEEHDRADESTERPQPVDRREPDVRAFAETLDLLV